MAHGDVVVGMQGQVVGVVTWQEESAAQMQQFPLLQPIPHRVTQALMLRDAVDSGNVEQTIAKWTGTPKL